MQTLVTTLETLKATAKTSEKTELLANITDESIKRV